MEKAMKVGMMQPAFMPWLGYFELISESDIFVFLDDFQFSVQSYHQRNRLFVNPGQADWYTVPVLKSQSFQSPLNRSRINEQIPWRVKFWKRLEQNYSKAPYFHHYQEAVKDWLMTPAGSLADQNIAFIRMICGFLGFEPEFRYSSGLDSGLKRSERVLELLAWCNADRYYCARGAFGYMLDDGVFPVKEIEVLFQDFRARVYPQVGKRKGFEERLSVLDALLNAGPEGTVRLIQEGTPEWITWQAMCQAHRLMDEQQRDVGQ
jgi:hypothetical protein